MAAAEYTLLRGIFAERYPCLTTRPNTVRLDKWLWAARFSRPAASRLEAIDGGKIQVNGERAKRAETAPPGR